MGGKEGGEGDPGSGVSTSTTDHVSNCRIWCAVPPHALSATEQVGGGTRYFGIISLRGGSREQEGRRRTCVRRGDGP